MGAKRVVVIYYLSYLWKMKCKFQFSERPSYLLHTVWQKVIPKYVYKLEPTPDPHRKNTIFTKVEFFSDELYNSIQNILA